MKTAVFFSVLCLLSISALVTGCRSTDTLPDFDFKASESDKLTAAERQTIVYHARRFVSESKNLKIDPVGRNVIRTADPEITLKYFGKKYGQIRLEWQLNRITRLSLYGTGDMTASEFPWKVQLTVKEESHPVPDRMRKNLRF